MPQAEPQTRADFAFSRGDAYADPGKKTGGITDYSRSGTIRESVRGVELMAFRRDPDAGRQAAAWLAVAFTMTCGAAVCSFIILAFADQPRQAFLVLGGILGGILLVLWLLGVVSGYTLGNFIYVLLVIAIVLFLVRLVSGRRVV